MSLTSPNEVYYKSRRFTVISSALLLLSIYVGITLGEDGTDPNGTLFSVKLKSPDSLPLVFLFVCFYSIWQFWTAWFVQTQEVRDYVVNKADCWITGVLAASGVISFFCVFSVYWFWTILLFFLIIWYLFFFLGTQKLKIFFAEKIRKKDNDISLKLTSQEWNLLFNPASNRVDNNKNVKFLENGNIQQIGESKGQNNETTWRIRDGLLEILNKDGKIFSRFRYNSDKDIFEHTNDDDTLSIRHQIIHPVTSQQN